MNTFSAAGASRVFDISPTISSRLAVWPGDTPPVREVLTDLHHGANLTLSTLHTTVHLGAHTDAPNHTAPDGDDIASQSLTPYLGMCQVITVDVARNERITPHHVRVAIAAGRVLFRTNTFPDPEQWNTDFAALSPALIYELADQGVILVGIDTPSVDLFAAKQLIAHDACVARHVRVLEGIVLDGVADGAYELIALPLRLEDFDASPVRAVLRTLRD